MSTQVMSQQAESESNGAAAGGEAAPQASTSQASTPAAGGEGGNAQGMSAAEPGAKEGDTPPGAEGGDTDPAQAQAPTYKPKDKFKVMRFGTDLQDEVEVPKLLREAMKDEASEKEIIDLLTKAHGLEPVKASREEIRKERDHFRQEFGNVTKAIGEVRKAYQRGDIDLFLDKLQIPQERMLQWALDKVNYSQLPPEQQKILDERRDSQRKAWTSEEQATHYQQQLHQQSVQARTAILDSSLARPEVKTFAEQYDARVGKPGAFRQEVIAQGELAWTQSNGSVDLSPEQAIQQAMQKWSPFFQQPQASAAQPSAQAQGSQAGTGMPAQGNTGTPAVIPNVQGRTSSPMKKSPRSLDDLRKLGKQAQT